MNLNDLRAQIEILRWCKAKRAEMSEMEATAKAAIQEAMGDDDTGTLDGDTAITWKTHKRVALDQRYLKKTFPDVYAECQTASEVRRFEVTE